MRTEEQRLESRVRSLATRRAYRAVRSRQRANVPNLDNFGDFMLVDTDRNHVVLGERFNATLEEIENFLRSAD